MTFAEITVAVDKHVAWRALLKGGAAIFTLVSAVVSAVIIPVLAVNKLQSRADETDRNIARLDETSRGLTSTVGGLQLQVATIGTEMKVMKSEQSRGFDRIEKLLDPPVPRPRPRQSAAAPAPRTQ